jgi:hypothetical protein
MNPNHSLQQTVLPNEQMLGYLHSCITDHPDHSAQPTVLPTGQILASNDTVPIQIIQKYIIFISKQC